jgi:hypothetical protein
VEAVGPVAFVVKVHFNFIELRLSTRIVTVGSSTSLIEINFKVKQGRLLVEEVVAAVEEVVK